MPLGLQRGIEPRAASWRLGTSWPQAFRSAGQGWRRALCAPEAAFEPAFGSAAIGRPCFIDHNKLFCLIKVASWSLVLGALSRISCRRSDCLCISTVNRPSRWDSRPEIVVLAACHCSMNFDLCRYVIVFIFPFLEVLAYEPWEN